MSPITRPGAVKATVVASLQTDLANAWVLYANYKHYHWEGYGPLFRDLHLMFDEFADAVFDTIDEIAERIRKLGPHIANVQLAEFQSAAIVESATKNQSELEMIEEAHANVLLVIEGMRQASRIADMNDDPGTVDLYSRQVQIHERAEWFLRQLLAKQDGLVT